jgi:hypothetical protein
MILVWRGMRQPRAWSPSAVDPSVSERAWPWGPGWSTRCTNNRRGRPRRPLHLVRDRLLGNHRQAVSKRRSPGLSIPYCLDPRTDHRARWGRVVVSGSQVLRPSMRTLGDDVIGGRSGPGQSSGDGLREALPADGVAVPVGCTIFRSCGLTSKVRAPRSECASVSAVAVGVDDTCACADQGTDSSRIVEVEQTGHRFPAAEFT